MTPIPITKCTVSGTRGAGFAVRGVMVSRRRVLSIIGLAGVPGAVLAKGQKERPAPLAPELVREFVGAAHGDLDKTKALLETTPQLLNATIDWGGGDFESAIGGAGHMGRKDIAEYLLSKGARMDLFVAAMLGKLDIVKGTLAAYPDLKSSLGPHGIPLMRHAEKGGDEAKAVLDYLKTLGD